jgi:hypothetical protein
MAVLLALVALSLLWSDSHGQDADGIDATFAMESKTLTLGEPVRVRFVVANHTPAPIEVALGLNRRNSFGFQLTRPDGRKSELPPLPRREGLR